MYTQFAPGATGQVLACLNSRHSFSQCRLYLTGGDKGAEFTRFGNNDPYVMQQDDIESLHLLNTFRQLRPDGTTLASILAPDKFGMTVNDYLRMISPEKTLRDMTNYAMHQGMHRRQDFDGFTEKCDWCAPDRMWSAVARVKLFKQIVAPAKLHGRKRPNMFPLVDTEILKLLGIVEGQSQKCSLWGTFWKVAQSDDVWERAADLHRELSEADVNMTAISVLRIIDMVLWLKVSGSLPE